jgi:NAD+ kinase
LVSVDGRSEVFDEKTELIIKKAPYSVRVVKQYDHTFFSTLKEKLMWGIDQRGSLK